MRAIVLDENRNSTHLAADRLYFAETALNFLTLGRFLLIPLRFRSVQVRRRHGFVVSDLLISVLTEVIFMLLARFDQRPATADRPILLEYSPNRVGRGNLQSHGLAAVSWCAFSIGDRPHGFFSLTALTLVFVKGHMKTSLGVAAAFVVALLVRLLAKFITSRMKDGPTKEMLSSSVLTGDNPADTTRTPRE
jgi:hypothetical protein